MQTTVLFAGVRVHALGPAVEWYERLFGRAADIVPNDDEVMWRVADGGWLYVLQAATHVGPALVTIAVADLDAAVAEVTARGVDVGAIEAVGTAARKATASDPEGNTVALIEVAS